MIWAFLLLTKALLCHAEPSTELTRLVEKDDTGVSRAFVVTKGCPQQFAPTSKVRLFVTVPSALQNIRRRQWVRASWCQSALRLTSVAVSFFVGSNPAGDSFPAQVTSEKELYRDIIVVPSWDDVDNVTAKQLYTMRYFAMLHGDLTWSNQTQVRPSYPTHYARFEDDVYPRLPLLMQELVNGHIRAFPGPETEIRHNLFVWAFFVQVDASYPYPCGGGMVLSANLVRAVAVANELAQFDVGAPRPMHCLNSSEFPCKPTAHGKGGYSVSSGWSTDDSFLGLMLRPYRYQTINDRRFHDPLGSNGLNAWPASIHSVAIQGLRSWKQFFLLHKESFDQFNAISQLASGSESTLEHRPNGESVVWMEVDGRQHGLSLSGCSQVNGLADSTCRQFRLDDRMCSILRSHFFSICPKADAWRISQGVV